MSVTDFCVQHASVTNRLALVVRFGKGNIAIAIETGEVVIITLLDPAVEIASIYAIGKSEDRVLWL
jgi:hypothetical protein